MNFDITCQLFQVEQSLTCSHLDLTPQKLQFPQFQLKLIQPYNSLEDVLGYFQVVKIEIADFQLKIQPAIAGIS